MRKHTIGGWSEQWKVLTFGWMTDIYDRSDVSIHLQIYAFQIEKKKYVLLWVMFSDWYRILVASNMLHIDCKKHLIWWQGIQHSLSVRALPRIYLLDVLPISFTIDDEIISRPIWYSCRFESMKLFQLHFHYTWFNHCMTKSQSFNLNHFYSMISVSIWNLNSTSGMILISMMKQLNRFYPFL